MTLEVEPCLLSWWDYRVFTGSAFQKLMCACKLNKYVSVAVFIYCLQYNIALLLLEYKCPLVWTLTGPFQSAGAANKVETFAFKTKIEQILSLHFSFGLLLTPLCYFWHNMHEVKQSNDWWRGLWLPVSHHSAHT